MSMSRRTRLIVTSFLAAAAVLLTVAGCSSSTKTASAASATSSASSTASRFGGGTGGPFANLDAPTLAKVKTCLSAAGLSLPTGGRRAGATGERPSGFPTDRPSGVPTGTHTGFPSGAAEAGRANFQAIRQALTACGITLPSGSGSRYAPSGAATPAPTG